MSENPFQASNCDYESPPVATQPIFFVLMGVGILAFFGGGFLSQWLQHEILNAPNHTTKYTLAISLPIAVVGGLCSIFSFQYTKVILLQAASLILAFFNATQVFGLGLSLS